MTYISGNTGTYQSGTFNKGTIALNLNPTSLGSGNNWYNGVDVTATQYLIYSDTYSQGQATQANSKPTAWTTPDLNDSSLLALINTLPDRVGLTSFTSLPLALQWLNATNKYFLIKTNFENIVTSGLVLNVDAGWYNSYSGTTTWFDRSGNGNSGTLVNSPTFNSSSQGTIFFDGSDDYINCGTKSSLDFGTGSATICVWFKTSASIGALCTKRLNSGFQLYVYSGKLYADGAGTPTGVYSVNNVNNNVWRYGVVVYDRSGSLIRLYVDGIADNTTSLGGTTLTDSGVCNIGSATLGNVVHDYFSGNIANTQIYNRALSAEEILQNYNAQKSRFGVYDVIQSGLTYSYDAGNYLSFPRSGTTWFDMTSNGRNGTLTNGPVWSSTSGGTIYFDGSNDYVAVGNGKTLNNMTFQMSVKVNSNSGGYKGFGGAIGSSLDYNTGFNIDMQSNSTVSFSKCSIEGGFLTVGGGTNFMTSSVPFGTWKNICFTVSPTYIQFYLDGVKQFGTNRLNNGSSTIGMNSLVIGARPYSLPNTSINADIRDVIIYDRALNDLEVVQNFESSRRKNFGLTGYTTSGLVLNLDAGNYASYPTTGTKWVDISGSYYNADVINGPTWSNVSGGTFTFDGTDDYGSFPTNNLPSGNSEISFDCWIRWGGLFSTIYGEFVMGYGDDSGPNKVPVILINTSNQVRFEFGSGAGAVISSSTISPNSWVNITTTYNKSSNKIYLNGVLNSTTSYSSANITPNGSNGYNGGIGTLFSIYGNKNSPSRYGSFSGNISSVRIYNVALSDSQVLQNYNALKGRFGL